MNTSQVTPYKLYTDVGCTLVWGDYEVSEDNHEARTIIYDFVYHPISQIPNYFEFGGYP